MEGTVSTVAEGNINREVRLKMWRISPVISEMVPLKDERKTEKSLAINTNKDMPPFSVTFSLPFS